AGPRPEPRVAHPRRTDRRARQDRGRPLRRQRRRRRRRGRLRRGDGLRVACGPGLRTHHPAAKAPRTSDRPTRGAAVDVLQKALGPEGFVRPPSIPPPASLPAPAPAPVSIAGPVPMPAPPPVALTV